VDQDEHMSLRNEQREDLEEELTIFEHLLDQQDNLDHQQKGLLEELLESVLNHIEEVLVDYNVKYFFSFRNHTFQKFLF